MARPKLPIVKLGPTDSLICKHCHETKYTPEFIVKRNNPLGYLRVCKKCHAKRQSRRLKALLILHPERREEKNRKHREKYKSDSEYRAKSLATSKRNRYKHHLKSQYGLTKAQVVLLSQQQGNRCAICGRDFIVTPVVDHNHGTRQVRGLLCSECNLGLGKFQDDPKRLDNAARYLRRVADDGEVA
jgi:hypothetical protein